ncbi:histidine kinase [Fulvivirgaceae bacterium BMA12]|uniref:Histidine kinase n=1 Tax=Agaribacillus aureus TaxID=3051825 RepID=A0ABT8LBV1_9BACT|nr:histidine kinase [Fulvivirgaceae bacterium BMA12]
MKKTHEVLLHVAFWVIYEFLPNGRYIVLSTAEFTRFDYVILMTQVGLNFANFYLYYFLIFRRFFFSGRKLALLIASVAFIIFCFYLRLNASRWVCSCALDEVLLKKYTSEWVQFITTVLYTGFAMLISLTIGWFKDQRLKTELITQNQASELALLRSQINPHFLFNTLNNIYSLVYQQSKNASQAVMRLSEIMRYMLKESNSSKVPLQREIDYLKSFIELQQLRIKEENFVALKVIGESEDKEIAPMLLIPFVENAFKYRNKNVDSPGIIVTLQITDNVLMLEVINDYKKDKIETSEASNSIGLKNVKRRLELLYKDRYELSIVDKEEESKFHIKLSLEL